jgi:hypothetical protein
VYHGVLFTSSLTGTNTASHRADTGKKAAISVLRSLEKFGSLSSNAFFKIYDTKISPILLCGAEMWGLSEFDCIEKYKHIVDYHFLCVSICYSRTNIHLPV